MEAATGASDRALRTLDEAEPLLGDDAWRAWHQRGLVLHWSGRSGEGLELLLRAHDAAAQADDPVTAAKLLLNLAVIRSHLGDTTAAAEDAAEAEHRCRALGEHALAAQALHNRGWLAARAGDPAAGWRLMHDAAAETSWTAPPVVLADRAEVAHLAGLPAEASELAESAWHAQLAVGDRHGAATTSLLRARVALDLGDPARALELLDELDELLETQGRGDLAGASAAIRLAAHRDECEQATVRELPVRTTQALSAVHASAVSIEEHPWWAERILGLLAAGEIELRAGHTRAAAERFDRVVADRGAVSSGTVEHHIAAALAARARTGHLDRERLEQAWAELERRRRMPAPHELRGDRGTPTRLITRITIPPLLEAGRGEEALHWLERLRSLPGPGGDPELGTAADGLRSLWARRRSELARRSAMTPIDTADDRHLTDMDLFDRDLPDPDLDGTALAATDLDDLDLGVDRGEDEARLEAELVARARSIASIDPARPIPTITEITTALGQVEMLWIVALNAGAWAIRCSASGVRVTTLDRHRLRSASQRLASAMRLASDAWREAAADLDQILGIGSGSGIGELGEQVVLIPVGHAVEDVPFAALPSLSARRLRTCWSGAHWLATRADPTIGSVTIASTGVDEADREVELLSRIWPGASSLEGAAVTTDRVLAALATDDLVHIGAHGQLRRDNPMLSTLECADGPLYGYELVRAGRVPGTVLLWSCALGGARMPDDVGVAGWPVMLARLGCNAVIAAPGALPSGPAPDLAAEVHRGLARGEPTDTVLAELRRVAVGELAARGAAMLAVHGGG